jgi:hypothetical protein
MKRSHAVVEKGLFILMLVLFIAMLIIVSTRFNMIKKKGQVSVPIDTESMQLFNEVALVQEQDIIDEINASSRSLDEYLSIIDRNPFTRFEPRLVEENDEGDEFEEEVEDTALFIYRGMARVGNVTRAVLEDKNTQEVFFVSDGDRVKTFKVLDIAQDTVILSQEDGQEIVVELAE